MNLRELIEKAKILAPGDWETIELANTAGRIIERVSVEHDVYSPTDVRQKFALHPDNVKRPNNSL